MKKTEGYSPEGAQPAPGKAVAAMAFDFSPGQMLQTVSFSGHLQIAVDSRMNYIIRRPGQCGN